jgi:hypothetical protein
MEQQGERQVLAPFRFPAIGATALPRRLVIGNNTDGRLFCVDAIVGHRRTVPQCHLPKPTVRGVCLLDMNNLKIHNLTAKIKKIREIREIRAKN